MNIRSRHSRRTGADESLGERVGTGSTDRRADDPDALGTEHLVEAGCELGIAVTDQKCDRSSPFGELKRQVPGLLDHHAPVGCSVMPVTKTFLVSSSMKNRT